MELGKTSRWQIHSISEIRAPSTIFSKAQLTGDLPYLTREIKTTGFRFCHATQVLDIGIAGCRIRLLRRFELQLAGAEETPKQLKRAIFDIMAVTVIAHHLPAIAN